MKLRALAPGVALLLVACPVPFSNPNATKSDLSPLLEIGAREGGLDSDLVAALRLHLSGSPLPINVRNLGLRPLLLLGSETSADSPPFFAHDIRHIETTHFVNFGENGFLLARLESLPSEAPRWPLHWATLQIRRPDLNTARSGVFATAQPISAPRPDLFSSLPAAAQESYLGPTSPSSCHLAAILRPTSFDLIDHASATCVLSRAPRDERHPQNEVASKVVCLHKERKFILNTHLDKVQFALPATGSDEVLFYEGAYHPPRISRLRLSDLDMSSSPRPTLGVGEVPPEAPAVIPEIPLAIYQCENAPTVAADYSRFWLMKDADIAMGIRLPNLEGDMAWVVSDSRESGLHIESRRWTDPLPPLDSLPSPHCTFDRHIDASCGLTHLRRGVALAGEILNGRLMDPSERAPLLAAAFLSLQAIERELAGWLLEQETACLLELFGNEILEKTDIQTILPAPILAAVRQRMESGAPLFREQNEVEHAQLRAHLGVPVDFWTALLANPK